MESFVWKEFNKESDNQKKKKRKSNLCFKPYFLIGLRKELQISKTIFLLKSSKNSQVLTINTFELFRKNHQEVSLIPNWLNGGVLVYELSSCGFEFRCSHLNMIYVVLTGMQYLKKKICYFCVLLLFCQNVY